MLQQFTSNAVKDGSVVHVGRKEMFFPNITPRQLYEGLRSYKGGEFVQDAFPFLTANQREFLMTGLTPEDWERMFPEYEE